MANRAEEFRLDLTLYFGESLFKDHLLSNFEHVLRSEAEQWASNLCIWRHKRSRIENFAEDVQRAALHRGPLFDLLVKQHGAGPYARRTGSVELRGAHNALIVVLILDDYRFAPSSGRWLWGNSLSFQFREPYARRQNAVHLARCFAARACADLSPFYANAQLSEEFDEKNTTREPGTGTLMAIGGDVSRYLPGLYWLNFFGEPYCNLMGKDRLMNAPAHETQEMDVGVLLYLASTPEVWNTQEYKATESRVLAHLGDKYFFNRHDLSKETEAPDFGLEPLPRSPRFT